MADPELLVHEGDEPQDLGPAPLARTLVTEQGRSWQVTPWRAATSGATAAGDGAILAPMPGRIIAVSVASSASFLRR